MLKKKNWGLQKVNSQLIMDFGFEKIMMNHIASEMISIIAQEQKMFNEKEDKLTTQYVGMYVRDLQHIINSKIKHGIFLETVQKKRESSRYFLKITGDSYFNDRLTPWALEAPEEYQEPKYTWLQDPLTGIGDYVWKEEKEREHE